MSTKIKQGIEGIYCDVCIGALIAARRALLENSAQEMLSRTKYGKGDTLGLDAIPEIVIEKRLNGFDKNAILITEELGSNTKNRWPSDSAPDKQPIMFYCDPTDRSKFLKKFLEVISKNEPKDLPGTKIGKLLKDIDTLTIWEELGESPLSITGATSAITCVRKGKIIFSVILNYISNEIFVAGPSAVVSLELPEYDDKTLDEIDLAYIMEHGRPLFFPSAQEICNNADESKMFTSFLGKTGYAENFKDSMIFLDNADEFLHHKEPGGPARILYLSYLQKGHGPIGFILANGEKITEWIHWLAFVKFSKNNLGTNALKIYEISMERPWTKDGILMSTSPEYSIFYSDEEGKTLFVDISRLKNFKNPSKFRSMLVVTYSDNETINCIMTKHQYREVTDYI